MHHNVVARFKQNYNLETFRSTIPLLSLSQIFATFNGPGQPWHGLSFRTFGWIHRDRELEYRNPPRMYQVQGSMLAAVML